MSGRYGDILWALPTVRSLRYYNMRSEPIEGSTPTIGEGFYASEIRRLIQCEMHLGIMPQFASLLPLLNAQQYVDKAFAIDNWKCTGEPYGCQPWEAPFIEGYDKIYHLTYQRHPSINQPLIDFIAEQQSIKLESNNVLPFIDVELNAEQIERFQVPPKIISYGFNNDYQELTSTFMAIVKETLEPFGYMFADVTKMSWINAAISIWQSACFIGCRSSNYVLSCGLNKRIFVYEPNSARSRFGMWGTTFTCPYAQETEVQHTYQLVELVKQLGGEK
jgi:hypothetical protein